MTVDEFYQSLLEISKVKGKNFPYEAKNEEESLIILQLIAEKKIGYGSTGYVGPDCRMWSITLRDPEKNPLESLGN